MKRLSKTLRLEIAAELLKLEAKLDNGLCDQFWQERDRRALVSITAARNDLLGINLDKAHELPSPSQL